MKIVGVTQAKFESLLYEVSMGNGGLGLKWKLTPTPQNTDTNFYGTVVSKKSGKPHQLVKVDGGVVGSTVLQPCHHVLAQVVMATFHAGAKVVFAEKNEFRPWDGLGKIESKLKATYAKKGLACSSSKWVAGSIGPSSSNVPFHVAKAAAQAPVMPAKKAEAEWTIEALPGDAITDGEVGEEVFKMEPRALEPAVTGLYLLQELALVVGDEIKARGYKTEGTRGDWTPRTPWKVQMLVEQFEKFKAQYERVIARNMFDYLVVASVVEARHSDHQALPQNDGVKKLALECDPRTSLPTVAAMFSEFHWSHLMGGKRWAKIANSASLYFKFAQFPVAFADHVVDLAHNCGCAFNKGYIIQGQSNSSEPGSKFMRMLDTKRNGSLLASALKLEVEDAVFGWLRAIMDLFPPTEKKEMRGELPEPAKGTYEHAMWELDPRDWRVVKVGGISPRCEIKPVAARSIPPVKFGSRTFAVTGPVAKKAIPATSSH